MSAIGQSTYSCISSLGRLFESIAFFCLLTHGSVRRGHFSFSQLKDWKRHKKACKAIKEDKERADSHTIHKAEFDRIRLKYGLDKKADEISDLLTIRGNEGGVSPNDFAEKFGTTPEEAVVFLEWIKVGIKFKEETLDVAKKSGLAGPSVSAKR